MVRSRGVGMKSRQSAGNLLSRRLGQKRRPRQASCGSSRVNLVDKRLVERNVDPQRSSGIGKQWHSEQRSAALDRRGDIVVGQNLVNGARQRNTTARALRGF